MVEDDIKAKFEAFSSKFEESIFTLISNFAEINENMSRVQEGLDFLGKLRIQTAENKQLMTKVEKAFKDLERKLREMSLDGFQLPDASVKEKKIEVVENVDDFLSTTVDLKEATESSDLSEFGSAEELPSVDDILSSNNSKTIEKPKPEIEIPKATSKPLESVDIVLKAPKVPPKLPQQPPKINNEELEISVNSEETTISTTEVTKQAVTYDFDLQENKSELTPAPRMDKSLLSPTPKLPKVQGLLYRNSNEAGLTPVPKPPSEDPEEKTIKAEEIDPSGIQKISPPLSPKDVWYNLKIEIENAKTNEQIALALGTANDNIKAFVRFHKVLFELLKTASSFRKSNPQNTPSQNDKDALLQNIKEWEIALK